MLAVPYIRLRRSRYLPRVSGNHGVIIMIGMKLRLVIVGLLLAAVAVAPSSTSAQKQKNQDRHTDHSLVSLSIGISSQIRDFYSSRPASGVKALPPGMRNRLAKGKPLPPGIAKQVAPPALRSHLDLPRGYDLVEVGLDVILVEVATGVIHDVLMDVVR